MFETRMEKLRNKKVKMILKKYNQQVVTCTEDKKKSKQKTINLSISLLRELTGRLFF